MHAEEPMPRRRNLPVDVRKSAQPERQHAPPECSRSGAPAPLAGPYRFLEHRAQLGAHGGRTDPLLARVLLGRIAVTERPRQARFGARQTEQIHQLPGRRDALVVERRDQAEQIRPGECVAHSAGQAAARRRQRDAEAPLRAIGRLQQQAPGTAVDGGVAQGPKSFPALPRGIGADDDSLSHAQHRSQTQKASPRPSQSTLHGHRRECDDEDVTGIRVAEHHASRIFTTCR